MGMGVVLPLEKPGRLVERVRPARRGGKYDDILRAAGRAPSAQS